MNAHDFRNLLAILWNLDYLDVEHIFPDIEDYAKFKANPWDYAMRLKDEERLQKLWEVIEARQSRGRAGYGVPEKGLRVVEGGKS
jgi:hypothetical protein